MLNRPLRIAFEGMHRSGKGTQLMLLHDFFRSNCIKSVVLRGAGSRLGKGEGGTAYYDPYDEYWRLFARDRLNGVADWEDACRKINSELNFFDIFLDFDVFLLDRCFVSSLFLLSQRKSELIINKPFIPDVVYYLRVDLDVLIDRVSADVSSKANFRRKNIIENYHCYDSYIDKYLTLDSFVVIDGSLEPVEIFNLIKYDLWIRFKEVLGEL